MAIAAGPYIIEIGGLRGVRGFSASEQFAQGGLHPEDPEVEAMFDALTDAVREPVEDAANSASLDRTAVAEMREEVASDKAIVLAAADSVAQDKASTEGYRDAAALSAVAADNSAAASLAAISRLYSDSATGLAAVSEGQYFLIVGTGAVYATLHRKVSGADSGTLRTFPDKAAVDAVTGTFAIDPDALDTLFSVANTNGDILFRFLASIEGLDIPNLRAVAITAASLAASGDIAGATMTIIGAATAGSFQLSGGPTIGASSTNLQEWTTPLGDIVARIANDGVLHVGGFVDHSDTSTPVVDVPANPFATVADSDIAAINAYTVPGLPGDVAHPPKLSNDTASYGVRGAHISGGIAITGSRIWALGMGRLAATELTGYVDGYVFHVTSIDNFGAIEEGCALTGSEVTPATILGVNQWKINAAQTVGSAGSPASFTVGAASVTGYISGTTMTIVTTTSYAALVNGASVSGSGVTTTTVHSPLDYAGPGTYLIDVSQTVASSGSPIAMVSTWPNNDGAEGKAAYGFLRYTDNLAEEDWKECLYLLPEVSHEGSYGDSSLYTLPDGRLWIGAPMNGTLPLVRASYGFIINNPEAVSGAFDIGRPNYLYKGTAMEPATAADEVYITFDEQQSGGPESHFGKLAFSGRDGAAFTLISNIPKVPAPYINFNESSVVPISGGRWIAYMRSTNGYYQTTSDYDGATWGPVVTWKSVSGFDTPVSRARFFRSPSGRCGAVFNNDVSSRINMRVALSEDSGVTFPWSVLIESRSLGAQSPSYPATAFAAGNLYVICDFGRRPDAATGKRMLIYRVAEELIRAGTATEALVSKFTAFT